VKDDPALSKYLWSILRFTSVTIWKPNHLDITFCRIQFFWEPGDQ
jgi:hypothetical protein